MSPDPDNTFFTSREKQDLTGNKVEYHSLPCSNITHFNVATAGHFDLDVELKAWISGNSVPKGKWFNKNLNVYQVRSVLAGYCRGRRPKKGLVEDLHQALNAGRRYLWIRSVPMLCGWCRRRAEL